MAVLRWVRLKTRKGLQKRLKRPKMARTRCAEEKTTVNDDYLKNVRHVALTRLDPNKVSGFTRAIEAVRASLR